MVVKKRKWEGHMHLEVYPPPLGGDMKKREITKLTVGLGGLGRGKVVFFSPKPFATTLGQNIAEVGGGVDGFGGKGELLKNKYVG